MAENQTTPALSPVVAAIRDRLRVVGIVRFYVIEDAPGRVTLRTYGQVVPGDVRAALRTIVDSMVPSVEWFRISFIEEPAHA